MRFDDRAADGEPQAYALVLGSEEGLKEALDKLWRESSAAVAHADEHAIILGRLRANPQFFGPLSNCVHSLDAIGNKVQDHLLQLHAIAKDARKFGCKFGL